MDMLSFEHNLDDFKHKGNFSGVLSPSQLALVNKLDIGELHMIDNPACLSPLMWQMQQKNNFNKEDSS